jgi:hypothetical protein
MSEERNASGSCRYVRAFLKLGDKRESKGGVGVEKASGMRKIGELGFGEDKTKNEIVEASHGASGITFGHTGSVFS